MSLYGQDSFNLEKQNLEDAIKQIASKSNMPYLVDGNLLKGKTSPKIENIEGVKNALDKVLENTGLEGTIENQTIIIKKLSSIKVLANETYVLDDVSVNSSNGKNGSAESGYLVKDVKTLGVWGNLSLQDTPYSMSVVSSDFIENTISSNFNDIAKKNPVLQDTGNADVSFTSAGLMTNIRGFSVSKVLIDGVPLIKDISGNSTNEVDNIEVISGLSGFLYGSGNIGGVINYALKYPTKEPITKVSIGNNGGQNYFTQVDSSQNITDKLSIRVNAHYQDGDKVKENSSNEEKLIGVSLAYKPTDNLDLGLYYSHREFKENGLSYWTITGKVPNAKDFDTKDSYAPDWTYIDTQSDKAELKANYNFNENWKVRSAFIYKYFKNNGSLYNSNNLNTTTGNQTVRIQRYGGDERKNYGGYVYLDGNLDIASINNNIIFGGSFANYEYEIIKYEYFLNKTLVVNDFSNFSKPYFPSPYGKYNSLKQYSTNLTIGDNITFNESWSALIGANLAKLETKNFNTSGTKTSGYDKDELTPTFSLIYKPIEDVTTYATYIENLENGMQQPNTSPKAGEFLDPYVSKQYEIGAKWSINQDLLLSTAIFRIEQQNAYQDPITTTYSADGEQINEGVEVLATGKASENLTLMGGFTYISPKVEKATNKATEGKYATGVAKYQAKLYAEYRLPVSPKIFLNGGVYYTGTQWVDNINTQKLPSYTTADLGARYETKLDGYDTTFRIYASNITDEKYWATNKYLGNPRTIGFSATLKF